VAPAGRAAGHSTGMLVALAVRTFVLGTWLVTLLWHGGLGLPAAGLALAIVAVWAVSFLRDRVLRDRARAADQRGWAATKAAM